MSKINAYGAVPQAYEKKYMWKTRKYSKKKRGKNFIDIDVRTLQQAQAQLEGHDN